MERDFCFKFQSFGQHDQFMYISFPHLFRVTILFYSVFMDSINVVGKIKYDLKAKKISSTKGRGEVIWHTQKIMSGE